MSDQVFTQCPNCKATFRIGIRRLRLARGEVQCQHCHAVFNALTALSENPGETPLQRRQSSRPSSPAMSDEAGDKVTAGARLGASYDLPSMHAVDGTAFSHKAAPWPEHGDRSGLRGGNRNFGWSLGALAALAILGWQISAFEGDNLLQKEALRPWLELACESFACELAPYRDTSQIQVVDRALLPAPDNMDGYEFSVIISNQSSLAQAFPSIRLVLSELNGRAIASRTFTPDEYLDSAQPAKMPVGKPFEIRLLLAKPSGEVGGFNFELI